MRDGADDGHKSWKCVYTVRGKPRWYHIGAVGAVGLSDARRIAAKVMYQVAEGKDPVADRNAERGRGTFEELAGDMWRSTPSGTTIVAAGRRAGAPPPIPTWGKMQAHAVTRADVRR